MKTTRLGLLSVAAAAAVALYVAGPSFAGGLGGGIGQGGLGGPRVGHTSGPGGASGQGSGGAPAAEKPKPKNILETISADSSLGQFLTAIRAAGLEGTLKGSGPYTILAPSDLAFLELDAEKRFFLMQDKAKLKTILQGHIVKSKLTSAEIGKTAKILTMSSAMHEVTAADGKPLEIAGAKIVTPDIEASNGLVQIIDKLLLPPEKAAKPAADPAAK